MTLRSMRACRMSLAALAASSLLVPTPSFARERTTLPAGVVLPLKLETQLSSRDNRSGDRFRARVQYGAEGAWLPSGTVVEGVVAEAFPARDGKPGTLDLDFRKVIFPDRTSQVLDGTLVDLKSSGIKRDSEGRLTASSSKDRERLKYVGLGAGAGVLVSGLTKGSTLQDVLIGAGAGLLYNELRKDRPGDVTLKEDTQLGVRLERPLTCEVVETSRRRELADDPDDRSSNRSYDAKRVEERERTRRESADDGEIAVMLNDRTVRLTRDVPFTRNGVVLVPLAPVMRASGTDWRYDKRSNTVRIGRDEVVVRIDSRVAVMGRQRERLEATPQLRSGVVYVPIRFLALAVHGSADWDESSRTVVVTTRGYKHD